jgi:hypothetical protein
MASQPRASLDRRVLESLKELHNQGAALYNAGHHTEAFHVYQGGLVVARYFLDHHPAVCRLIDEGLQEVSSLQGNIKLRAFRLHEVIDQVRADMKAIWKSLREGED